MRLAKPMIRLNLGNGDLIALAGAICVTAKEQGKVFVPSMRNNHDNALALFASVPEVEIFVVESSAEMLGYEGPNWVPPRVPDNITKDHYAFMYEKLGLDYALRWSASPIPESRKRVTQIKPPKWPYQFVHDDPTRGFVITSGLKDGMSAFRMFRLNAPLISWCDVIENAEEIHCIDSSAFHLALHCQPKTDKLFLHQGARPYEPIWMDYDTGIQHWTVVH